MAAKAESKSKNKTKAKPAKATNSNKKSMLTTPGGNSRIASTISGAIRHENVVVLLGRKSQNIDFKKCFDANEAIKNFNEFKILLLEKSKRDLDSFVEMPSGNLLRESMIMALEPITKPREGIIVRDTFDNIVDFLDVAGEENHQIIIKAIRTALENKAPSGKNKTDWVALGIR